MRYPPAAPLSPPMAPLVLQYQKFSISLLLVNPTSYIDEEISWTLSNISRYVKEWLLKLSMQLLNLDLWSYDRRGQLAVTDIMFLRGRSRIIAMSSVLKKGMEIVLKEERMGA